MRKLLLLLILLSGCKVVTMDEMRRAEAACKAHGGMSYAQFSIITGGIWIIRCEDGTEIVRLQERGKK